MIALSVWVAYLVLAFVVIPGMFRVRHGCWPFVFPPTRSFYTVVEGLFGAVYAVYTVGLVFGASARPVSIIAGLAVTALSLVGLGWALAALGPNWRIGLDTSGRCVYVRRGPYRFIRHPIYVSLILIALGQVLLAGLDWRTLTLLVATLLYYVLQGRSENRFWRLRS
jgi:protein-S-isoprenylcysteine O-methyltransferase Ste14